jgi:ferric-dicitrate binding protein FerR (iron transport regulator)
MGNTQHNGTTTNLEILRGKIFDGSASTGEINLFKSLVDKIVDEEFAATHQLSETELKEIQSNLHSFWSGHDAPEPHQTSYRKLSKTRRLELASFTFFVTSAIILNYFFPTFLSPSAGLSRIQTEGPSFISLPDGSGILLKKGSTISYCPDFPDRRYLVLHGEAYIDVAPDPEHKFSVLLDDVAVTALGTSFSIEANNNRDTVIVNVVHGRVSVHTDEHEFAQIDQNERLIFFHNKADVSKRSAVWKIGEPLVHFEMQTTKPAKSLTWNDLKLILNVENMPLEKIAEKLSQYSGIDIRVMDKRSRETRITGAFTNEIPVTEILRILSRAAGCNVFLVQSDPLIIGMGGAR